MKPETRAEAAAWLAKADVDLRAARADLAAVPPITSDALFHCQQAIEKALKAFLTAHERPPARTHDLEELGVRVIDLDPSLREPVSRSYHLSVFASEFRYPGDSAEPERGVADSGLEEAVAVVAILSAAVKQLG
jgi:HEPN domain-containing protein